MALQICSPADVYDRFGGQEYLSQALDNDGDGVYDTGVLTKAIQDASEEVAAYANVQVDVAGLTTYPHLLISLTAQVAVLYCWRYGTQGRATPQIIQDSYQRALDMLGRISRREVSIGAPTSYPSTNQTVKQVDIDPENRRMTLCSWQRGFV